VIKLQKYPNLAPYSGEYRRDAGGFARTLSAMLPSQDKVDLVQAYVDLSKFV
jgi:hypothetical protein